MIAEEPIRNNHGIWELAKELYEIRLEQRNSQCEFGYLSWDELPMHERQNYYVLANHSITQARALIEKMREALYWMVDSTMYKDYPGASKAAMSAVKEADEFLDRKHDNG